MGSWWGSGPTRGKALAEALKQSRCVVEKQKVHTLPEDREGGQEWDGMRSGGEEGQMGVGLVTGI